MYSTKIAALAVALFLGTTSASDVYALFQDSKDVQVGSVTYDVGNDACFFNSGSVKVSFSQGGINSGTANGPYCLTGFSDDGCGTQTGAQTFSDVSLSANDKYNLNDDVSSGPYKKWTTQAC